MEVTYARSAQRTLGAPVGYCGPAAGGQRRTTVVIRPALPDTGARFVRNDLPGGPRTLPVRIEYLATDGAGAMLECPSGVGIHGVGPFLVAMAACGIDNAEIMLDGPEAVLPEGGKAALVAALEAAGAEEQTRPLRVIKIERSITVDDDGRRVMLRPSNVPHAAISLDDADRNGRHRWLAVGLGEKPLRELIRSLANRGGESTGSEPLRHGLLECVGYLAAAGAPIIGHFLAQNPDHDLMRRLVRTLASQQGSWSRIEVALPA